MNTPTKPQTQNSALCLALLCLLLIAPAARAAQSNTGDKKGGKPTAAAAATTPTEVIRAFYTALRERRFRDAMLMTVLRPAVEALSASELAEYQPDFERLAPFVPTDYEITGEQLSGETATVFVKTGEGKDVKVEGIELMRDRGAWIVGKREDLEDVKKQGKKFFPEARIAAHEEEAETMLKRIAAAQVAYALQNSGSFADLNALVRAGYVPQDILGTETTGYSFTVAPGAPGKGYVARAEPARYGRTGRLSFYMDQSGIQKKDTGGKPFNPQSSKKK